MALTRIDFEFWVHLREKGHIPPAPAVVEFGQANWYGDVPLDRLAAAVDRYADPAVARDLLKRLDRSRGRADLFGIGRVFYSALLRERSIGAIDLHGPPAALPLDLNQPLGLSPGGFDILINSGTAEHVFDQRQLFQSAHDVTRPGGLMVHALPLWGWLDHGFYNYHPTFVADLAAANGYETLAWWWAEIDSGRHAPVARPGDFREIARRMGTAVSAMMYVAWKRPEGEAKPFRVPMQGYYAGTLEPEDHRAWHEER